MSRKQETKTIETPFGTATIHDYRNHETPEHGGDRATIAFERLTINRKDYGDKRFSLTGRRYYGDSKTRYYLSESSYQERLTNAADKKLEEFFLPGGEPIAELQPYIESLDAEDVRQATKNTLAHQVFSSLHDAVEKTAVREHEVLTREFVSELVDELLVEAATKRQDGVSYADIYLKRKG